MANFYTAHIQFQYQVSTGVGNLSRTLTIRDIPTIHKGAQHSEDDYLDWEELLVETFASLFKAEEIENFLKCESRNPTEKNHITLRRLNNASTIEEVIKARFKGVHNVTLVILEHTLDTTQDNPELKTEVLLEDFQA